MTKTILLLAGLALYGCGARRQTRTPQPQGPSDERRIIIDAEYEAVARSITQRVVALRSRYPALRGISAGSFGGGGNSVATLYFEYRTTWVLDDPTKPHSKTNGRRAIYGEGGFWFRLYFYRGRYEGAAMFRPIEFGDLNLWFQYGHGGDASIIAEVTTVLREENEAFCRLHP